ncbi:MAG: hypothetical protein DRJ50_13580, partial [Actinobacteria bacterium]
NFRCENGPEIEIGVRRKNGKAEPSETDPQKPALKIDINEFVPGQAFSGKVKLDLENGGDSSGGTSDGGSENGLREGFSWFLMNEAGVVASRVAWVNIWINGDLKGLYTHVEQVDKSFLVDHGIDDGGWLFKGPSNEQRTREGEPNPFYFNWYPFDHVSPEEPQPADWHDQTPQRVDMPQVLTVAATTNFIANTDGVIFKDNNYWYYDWSVFPEGQQPRLYLPWDLDTTLKKTDEAILGRPHNNGHMAQALLRDDPFFQAQYYQTYNDLLNGPLSLSSTQAYLDTLEPILSPHINADPNQTVGSALDQFQMVRDFLAARTTFVTNALGSCSDGSCDSSETQCTCPADCGTPPTSESVCFDLADDDCDGPIDCADADCALDPACEEIPAPNTLLITEIVANSPGSPDVEYVEILNLGPGAQDLTGWFILDDNNTHDRCFLNGILDVGEYRVVAGIIDEFSVRYPDALAQLNDTQFDSESAGIGFSLGDGGDEIRLFRPGGPGEVFIHGYTFGPQGEEIPFGYVPQDSDAPEHIVVPTPGLNNGLSAARSPICINEFLTTSQSGGIDDWIELFNRGAADVDIGGWHLSDSASTPDKYTFPAGTIVSAGGFLLIDETELGFSLSSTGSEVIVLTHADGETGQDYLDYRLQFPDVTRGRFPDGAPYWASFASPSPGTYNGCIVENLEFVLATELVWDAFPGTPRYDIVRGELGLLRASTGDYSQAITGCLDNDRTQTNWVDTTTPSAGTAVFYLVRVVETECPVGTYDSQSTRQWSRRDESIAGAAAACP